MTIQLSRIFVKTTAVKTKKCNFSEGCSARSAQTQVGEGEDEEAEPNLGYLKRSPVSRGLGEPGWTSQGLLTTMMSSGLCWGEASRCWGEARRGRQSPSPGSCHWLCSLHRREGSVLVVSNPNCGL